MSYPRALSSVSTTTPLEHVSQEFVAANYDLRQLIRWICNSEAYNLSSRINPKNPKSKQDNPAGDSDVVDAEFQETR